MVLDFLFKVLSRRRPAGRVLLLEAFAGPAQGPRVDVPPSAAVSGSLAGVKRRGDKVPSVLAHCKRYGNYGSRVTDWNDGQLSRSLPRIDGLQ